MNKWKWLLYTIFGLNLLVILFFWWSGSANLFSGGTSYIILAIARLFGLLAVFFVLLQFIMRGRAVWVEEVFGLNNLATAHRLNGYLSLSFITLHILLILICYSMVEKKNILNQLIEFVLLDTDFFKAFFAFLLFLLIIFLSIYIIRKKLPYETWYSIHLFSYIAVLLAWGHQLTYGGDFIFNPLFVWYWYGLYIFVFGNLFIFRFLRQGYLFYTYRFKVAEVIQEADKATSVYITGNNLSKFSVQPGQFFVLRFLDKKRWMEAHPFSLSFVPKNNSLRVTIKNVGDFTAEISKLKKGTPVLIDGPFGTFTAPNAASSKQNKYLFIAGGVGITPIRALIEALGVLKKDVILLYSNKTKDIIFKKELDELSVKYNFPIYYILTKDPLFEGEKGRIDAEKIKKLAPDFLKRDIYLCGPVPMMEALVKILQNLGVSKTSIHYERFSL